MADDAASVTRTGISYHTKEELIAKIAGGTVAEVKPYTQEERDLKIRWGRASIAGAPVPDDVVRESDARWEATLAAVEKDRDEALARLTYWYEPDGTVTTHDPEKVKSMRIAAAKQIADLRITLAASQATAKELRDRLKAFIAWRTEDGLPLRHVVEITEEVVYAEAALARTDDMGALEALLTEAVESVDVDDFPVPPGVWVGDDGKETQGMKDYNAAVAKMRKAVVARLMRRAGGESNA